jgi:hypothetical protein
MTYRRSRSVPPHRIGRPRGCYPRAPSTKAVRRGGPTTFHQPNRDAQIKGCSSHLRRRGGSLNRTAALPPKAVTSTQRASHTGSTSGRYEPPFSGFAPTADLSHNRTPSEQWLAGRTTPSRPSLGTTPADVLHPGSHTPAAPRRATAGARGDAIVAKQAWRSSSGRGQSDRIGGPSLAIPIREEGQRGCLAAASSRGGHSDVELVLVRERRWSCRPVWCCVIGGLGGRLAREPARHARPYLDVG